MAFVLGLEDLEQLSQELMKLLRGSLSQREFGKALGFTSNVAYAWESGRRFPEASVFLKAVKLAKPSCCQAFLELIAASPELVALRWGTPHFVQKLLVHLAGDASNAEMSSQLKVDRNTFARWLVGETEPRLPDFLKVLETGTQRLLDLVALLVDPAELSSTRDAYRDLKLQRKLAYDLPWSHALLRGLELTQYRTRAKHSIAELARSVGLSARRAERFLGELQKAGQVRWTGTHYEGTRILTVDTRADPRGNAKLKRHWARVSLRRLEDASAPAEAFFSYNLFAVDEVTFQRIRQLHAEYFERVRSLVEESSGTDRVVLMNQQLVPLAKAKPSSG